MGRRVVLLFDNIRCSFYSAGFGVVFGLGWGGQVTVGLGVGGWVGRRGWSTLYNTCMLIL